MNKWMLQLAAILGLGAFVARAQVALTPEDTGGNAYYRLGNGRISILVDPAQGGTVMSYRDKLGGDVELVSDGHPFLVLGEVGPKQARVACLMGVPMGSFGEGETPFWEWEDWIYLLRQLNWWVLKENHRFRAEVL